MNPRVRVTQFWDPRKDNGWLSNFWHAPIMYKHKEFRTSEHLYQALKCITTPEFYERIRTTHSPKDAKELAHELSYSQELEVKVANMRLVIRLKFDQHPGLQEQLINTVGTIAEISPTDLLWGTGHGGTTPGVNLMGLLLMELRAELQHKK